MFSLGHKLLENQSLVALLEKLIVLLAKLVRLKVFSYSLHIKFKHFLIRLQKVIEMGLGTGLERSWKSMERDGGQGSAHSGNQKCLAGSSAILWLTVQWAAISLSGFNLKLGNHFFEKEASGVAWHSGQTGYILPVVQHLKNVKLLYKKPLYFLLHLFNLWWKHFEQCLLYM